MGDNIRKAFILGAGFGTRMRPLTDDRPKPMVELAGQSLIYHTLDRLRRFGIDEVVVNTHYLADVMAQHLSDYAAQHSDITIHISHEDDILDTGGGVRKALHYFGGQPFFVIAGDNFWTDGETCALERLSAAWDADKMDIITLMMPIDEMTLTRGVGDYDLAESGRATRSKTREGAYMWTNIRLNAPHVYERYPEDQAFSFLEIMDSCEAAGRLHALPHDGEWHHLSTPEDVARVEAHLRSEDKG